MEWIDLGCYRVQQILITDLPVTLAAITTDRDDGLDLPAPPREAVHIGDQVLNAGSVFPCVEIKAPASFRSAESDMSPDQYQHRLQIVLSAVDTRPSRLELRIMRYGLALLQTLNGRGLQPEMAAEIIAGNLFYTLLDKIGRGNAPFVRSVALECAVTSLTNRGA